MSLFELISTLSCDRDDRAVPNARYEEYHTNIRSFFSEISFITASMGLAHVTCRFLSIFNMMIVIGSFTSYWFLFFCTAIIINTVLITAFFSLLRNAEALVLALCCWKDSSIDYSRMKNRSFVFFAVLEIMSTRPDKTLARWNSVVLKRFCMRVVRSRF